MMLYELDRLDEGLFFCLFDTPDRLQHMFWRYREEDLPANGKKETRRFGRTIEEHYASCDQIVGRVLDYVDEETLLIVLSDHGMGSFQRGFHLNSWLYQNGFLKLKPGRKPGPEAGTFLSGVDWANTKAYGIGLGAIYLNLREREGEGSVKESEVEEVKNDLVLALSGLEDRERGRIAIRNVLTCDELYKGPYAHLAPDLMINFATGYRVSWDTPLGGVPEGLFEDNCKKWSGDHVIDPKLVPGILLLNHPFRKEDAALVDLAPTILRALGAESKQHLEGSSLL